VVGFDKADQILDRERPRIGRNPVTSVIALSMTSVLEGGS
jgi:hypothetical protein